VCAERVRDDLQFAVVRDFAHRFGGAQVLGFQVHHVAVQGTVGTHRMSALVLALQTRSKQAVLQQLGYLRLHGGWIGVFPLICPMCGGQMRIIALAAT